MDPIITNALVSFGAAFSGSAINKAEGPGRALDDIMTLIGFEKLHVVAEKKRAKREQNILDYKESIAQKLSNIPKENIQEPPLSVVGPALEASKYYIEEEELREMFANLIANSMDDRKKGEVHPSFVEIIKQLNVNEAHILEYIKNVGYRTKYSYPIIQISKESSNGEREALVHPVIFLYDYTDDFLSNSASINNLERLGIVKTSFIEWFAREDQYDIYKSHPELSNILKVHTNLKMNNGIMRLTDFGNDFIQTCVLCR